LYLLWKSPQLIAAKIMPNVIKFEIPVKKILVLSLVYTKTSRIYAKATGKSLLPPNCWLKRVTKETKM